MDSTKTTASQTTQHGRPFQRSKILGGIVAVTLALGVPTLAAAPAQADTVATAAVTADSGRTVGTTEATNTVPDPTQCTYGAKEKFHEATGLYPAFKGNAYEWADTAAATGWTTVLDAQARSIVVFQPGVQGSDATYGHVAWVDSIEQHPDGLYINITELNGVAGPGQWGTRQVKDVPGMSYILAP